MSHRLSESDRWFLQLNRKDVLTQEPFKLGNEVVVCANCKTVILKDSWDYCISNKTSGCCICGKSVQHRGFERSFICPSYTHPVVTITDEKFKITRKDGVDVRGVQPRESIVSERRLKKLFNFTLFLVLGILVLLVLYIFIDNRAGSLIANATYFFEDMINKITTSFLSKESYFDFGVLIDKWQSLWHTIFQKISEILTL